MRRGGGDAARAWHGLDHALATLREARKGYEEAGRDDLVEDLEELLGKTGSGRGEAGREVARLLEGGPGEVGAG